MEKLVPSEERGMGPCSKCGKQVMYGRHLRGESCVPCLDCEAIGIGPRHPCIHDLVREDDAGNRWEAELVVWGI